MTEALIMMDASLPTRGHEALVQFAMAYPGVDTVHVVIPSRSWSPVPLEVRVRAFEEAFWSKTGYIEAKFYPFLDDNAPQDEPEDRAGKALFWSWWKYALRSVLGDTLDRVSVVFASESYGAKLAEALDKEFVQFDIERSMFPIRGTEVRQDIYKSWDQILPEFRKTLQKSIVLFGQESVGKTTLARSLTYHLAEYHPVFVPEYARPYLERVGPQVTASRMASISRGQFALERMIWDRDDCGLAILDTDLLSTIGYYRVLGWEVPGDLMKAFYMLNGRYTYFLCPDDIPVEPDPLRYGGDARESTYEFWKTLLVEFGCHHIEVPAGSLASKRHFIQDLTKRIMDAQASTFREYSR